MKKPAREKKSKLLGFAEQLSTDESKLDPAAADIISSVQPAAIAAAPSAPPPTMRLKEPAPKPATERRRTGIEFSYLLATLGSVAVVVFFPPAFFAVSLLAFPLLILISCIGIWKTFDRLWRGCPGRS